MRGCLTSSPLTRSAVVLSLVFASTPVSASPSATATAEAGTDPLDRPPPRRELVYSSDRERLEALDERYGDAYPDSKGIGMRKAGLILTVVGGAALGLGIPLLAVGVTHDGDEGYGSAIFLGMSSYLVVPGFIALSVGVPMLVKGGRRRTRYYEWLDQQEHRRNLSFRTWRMKPLFSAGRVGWAVGLSVNF